ncbi:inositol monophosphatase family protein [candidate division KSB1 bacterium]
MEREYKDRLYSIGKELTVEAGKFIRESYEGKIEVKFKGRIDIVTDIDKKAESIIVNGIKENFPDHNIITEETDFEQGDSDTRWIIDPLDGTTNFSHGFPFFCVSVGIEYKNEVIIGFVYDPLREEMFEAKKGESALLNGKRIKPSSIDNLEHSLLATGFPYDIKESENNNVDYFNHMIFKAQAVRRAGSAALDLCYIACGRLDGYWEIKLSPWDTAAAGLIVKEAGGRITDFDGRQASILHKQIAATNGVIHEEMLRELGVKS